MLVLVPVIWMLLAFGPRGSVDDNVDETHLREAPARSSDLTTGKPIKIPPKKV